MGRIGKRIIEMPKGVEIKVEERVFEVKGPRGKLAKEYNPLVKIEVDGNKVRTICDSALPKHKALHGLYNSLLKNMVDGVLNGFEKRLEIVGVGYRAAKQGKDLHLQMGYSHPVIVSPPEGIEIVVEGNNKITVKGIDKQMVGEIAAEIRGVREVECYKGKGIRYVGEKVRKKAGKAAKAALAA